jgi:MscS family membrane protein
MSLITWIQNNLWITYAIATLVLTMIAHVVIDKVLSTVKKRLNRKSIFIKAFIKAIISPIKAMIWLVGISVIFIVLLDKINLLKILPHLQDLPKVGSTIIFTWAIIKFINLFSKAYVDRNVQNDIAVDVTLVHAFSQLAVILTGIFSLLIIMQILSIPMAGILAFGGIGGAGVALAAKDMLANFFGGMIIYVDRPFGVGDWIRSSDKNIEGIVEYIGWRVTKIQTFEKRPLYIPNGVFLTISVENPSQMTNRRIKTIVGVRYEDVSKINFITKDIQAMLETHPDIDNTLPTIATLTEFGASSLNILVSTYTTKVKSVDFYPLQHEIMLKLLDIVAKHGAECAFPTQTIHIENAST